MIENQFTGRRMKLNHSCAIPRYIIAVDTETVPAASGSKPNSIAHRFRLGVMRSGRLREDRIGSGSTIRFTEPSVFWDELYRLSGKNYTVWCVAHNALYDLVAMNFAEEFDSGRMTIDKPRSKRNRDENDEYNPHNAGLLILDSPPLIIGARCTETQGRIVFVDTLNYFRCPLRDMGTALGIEKSAIPPTIASDEIWFDYCERDVDICFETFVELIRWQRKQDFGMFRYTAASQAMSAYRHRFMRRQIYVHDNAEVKKLERNAYFGGRTEVFRKGKIDRILHHIDVNSLYPSVMKGNLFPCRLIRSDTKTKWCEPANGIDWLHSVAEVYIETDNPIYPFRHNGIVTYPVGCFVTNLCGPELYDAIESGRCKKVKDWAEYECATIFYDWVDCLWSMRQRYKSEGNRLYEQFVKSLLNSLYGKFGEKSPKWVPSQNVVSGMPWSTWYENDGKSDEMIQYRSFGGEVQKMVGRGELERTFVAISAFVAAYGRWLMNNLRIVAGQSEVWYQGVDALITTTLGLDRLKAAGEIAENDLGKLRLLTSTNFGEIYGCSDYRLGERTIISGRSRESDEISDGVYLQRRLAAASSIFTGDPCDEIPEVLQRWTRIGGYRKGIVAADGTVLPLVVNAGIGIDNR